MKRSTWIHITSIFLLSFFAFEPIQARVVNSEEDRQRLLGWDAQQRENQKFEKDRLTDVKEVDRARKSFENDQKKDLETYRVWKSKQKASLDESSPEYKQDLKLKVEEWMTKDRQRESFVKTRDGERKKAFSTVKLTEETELGLDQQRERADWDQRFEAQGGSGSGSKGPGSSRGSGRSSSPSFGGGRGGGSNTGSERSDYIPPEFDAPPPPPPMAPPAEFFEPEVPPPPPIDEGEPGSLDEGPVPPVIEDDF